MKPEKQKHFDEVTLGRKLINEFLQSCQYSTIDGLQHISRSNNWIMRSLWILFFFASFSCCLISMIKSLTAFYSYEVVMTISGNQELPAIFPAVTFCNLNPFNEIRSYNYIVDVMEKLKNAEPKKPTNEFDSFLDRAKRVIANNGELNSSIGYYLQNEMLVSCEYNSRKCNEKNFSRFWSNEYGNCFSFNTGINDILKTSVTGDRHGLKLELVVKPPSGGTKFFHKTGIYLKIHNQNTSILSLTSGGISIQTGLETHIGMRRKSTKKLGYPYADCLKSFSLDSEYAKKIYEILKQFQVSYYDQNLCLSICYQDKLIEKCNCSDIMTPKIKNHSYCTTYTEISCMNRFEVFFTSRADLNKICNSACPQQCNIDEFNLVTSMSTFPTLDYIKYLQLNDTNDVFPKNVSDHELIEFSRDGFLKLIVNYNTLYYEKITENPKVTPENLFGTLGGQFGLFIGLSLISIMEIIYLFINLFLIILRHYQAKIDNET